MAEAADAATSVLTPAAYVAAVFLVLLTKGEVIKAVQALLMCKGYGQVREAEESNDIQRVVQGLPGQGHSDRGLPAVRSPAVLERFFVEPVVHPRYSSLHRRIALE